jgi:outer membrane protein assembly factor BamB
MPRTAFAALLLAACTATAADWPQWLGPKRQPVWEETGLVDELPAGGPPVRWRVPVGMGYAGPAVAGGRVYLMDRRTPADAPKGGRGTIPGTERVLCLDLATGKQVWADEYDCPYTGISYPEGPRATPVVAGGKVYTLGTMGHLRCLDAATGKLHWAADISKGVEKRPVWGYSAHLLLDGDRLITLVGGDGGAVRAYSAADGQEVWKALSSQEVGYAPPVVAGTGADRQVVVWLSDRLAGLDPATGTVLWRLKHPDLPAGKTQMRPAVTIVTPTVADDLLFVSTAYEGACCVRLQSGRKGAEVVWKADNTFPKDPEKLPTLMTTLLHRDGHLYGVDVKGKVRCLKAATGEPVWEDDTLYGGKDTLFGTAFWVWAGDRVFALTDLGDLVLCKLTPKGYEELGRAHVIDATFSTRGRTVVWAHPAFADRCLVARNDREVVCVSLAKG